jgi:hypothetical protein
VIAFPCQTEDSPLGPVTRAYAAVRLETQPPKRRADESTAPTPEWIAFEFLINPGYDISLVPKQVGEALLLKPETGDKRVSLRWRGTEIKALIKTVRMEIEEKSPFRAQLAWAYETDDVPLVLGQLDVFSKVYDVDFSIVKGKVRFSMQGSEYDQILTRINEANPRLKRFQVDDPTNQHTMQFVDVDSVCFIERLKVDSQPKRKKKSKSDKPEAVFSTRFTAADGKLYFSEIGLWELEELLADNPSWFRSHKSNFVNLRRIVKVKKDQEREVLFEGQPDFRSDLFSEDRIPEFKRRLKAIV